MKRKKEVKLYIFMAILVGFLGLSACGTVTVKADISEYGDMPITIVGVGDTEFQVTANELSQLPCISQSVSGKTEKAGTIKAVGPTLETFLAQYGKDISDYTRIRFEAADGYKKGFLQEELATHEFILAVANGDLPLGKEEAPLRLVVPGAASDQWVRMVIRIEFITE